MERNGQDRETAQAAFAELVQVRNVDTRLLWTRSQLIMTLEAAVFAAYGVTIKSAYEDGQLTWRESLLLIGVSLAGLAIGWLWTRIVKGGAWWRRYWNRELAALEAVAFGNTATTWRRVVGNPKKTSIPAGPEDELGGEDWEPLRKIVDGAYSSPTKALRRLAWGTVYGWGLLGILVVILAWLGNPDPDQVEYVPTIWDLLHRCRFGR